MASTKQIYNRIAKEYYHLRTKKYPQGWFYNEMLEMPTTLRLLGNIKGKRILDLGCGPGIYAKILFQKGALIKGTDISDKEVEIARRENPQIEFSIGNAENMIYQNGEFDIVLATLVLEYFKDWSKILREIRRVLKKKGLFIFSMGNPVSNCIRINSKKRAELRREYFKEAKTKSKWWRRVYMTWYHKTYGTIIRLLIKSGFELVNYEDCKPIKKAKKLFPMEYTETTSLPYFCTWVWRKK